MKKLTLYAIAVLISLIICCKKDVPETSSKTFDITKATLLKQGNLVSNVHQVSGTVKLYQNGSEKVIYFENFKTDAGPDLRVYFSDTTNNVNYTELGLLQANSGSFYYTLNTSVNANDYKYILIWCKQYSVLFGNSKLN